MELARRLIGSVRIDKPEDITYWVNRETLSELLAGAGEEASPGEPSPPTGTVRHPWRETLPVGGASFFALMPGAGIPPAEWPNTPST